MLTITYSPYFSPLAGISRSSRHKRSATGAQRAHYRKKRKFELGRQAANTKLGVKRIHTVRVRGGNLKYRALRLDSGNFAWGSEHVTRKTRIIGVVRISVHQVMLVKLKTKFIWKRCTMLLTMNWCEPTPSSRVPLSRSMRRLSDCGTSPTCVSFVPMRFRPLCSHSSPQYAQPVTKKGAKAAAAEEKKDGEEKKLSNHAQRSLDERRKGKHRFFLLVWSPGADLTNRRCSDAKIDNLLETQFGAGRLYAAISSRPGQVGRADGYILEGKELEVGFKFRCGRCVSIGIDDV